MEWFIAILATKILSHVTEVINLLPESSPTCLKHAQKRYSTGSISTITTWIPLSYPKSRFHMTSVPQSLLLVTALLACNWGMASMHQQHKSVSIWASQRETIRSMRETWSHKRESGQPRDLWWQSSPLSDPVKLHLLILKEGLRNKYNSWLLSFLWQVCTETPPEVGANG